MRPSLDTPIPPSSGASASAPTTTGAVRCVVALGNALGEGVLWSVREQAVYWVDILQRELHRWDPATSAHQRWTFDEEIRFFPVFLESTGASASQRSRF